MSENSNSGSSTDSSQNNDGVTFWMVLKSVLAAMFGVQSSKNRERDFTRGKASHFIMVGILALIVFVLTILGLVKLVMTFAV